MAFDAKYFGPLGGQSKRGLAPQMWGYRTADTLATVDSAGYFNAVRGLLELGDVIVVSVVDSAAAPTSVVASGMMVVKDKSDTAIDVADATALNVSTDTD